MFLDAKRIMVLYSFYLLSHLTECFEDIIMSYEHSIQGGNTYRLDALWKNRNDYNSKNLVLNRR